MNSTTANELNPLTSEELLRIQKDVAYYRKKYQVGRVVG